MSKIDMKYKKAMPSKQKFKPEEIKKMSKFRIIQKNLVHVYGFPDSIADKTILGKFEYFGQFGKITKIVLTKKEDNDDDVLSKDKAYSAYITYSKPEEASLAILAVDNFQMNGNVIRAFYGTSKYCFHFLNSMDCFNKDKCMYLHTVANDEDILGNTPNSKFGMQDHQMIAMKIANIFNEDVKKNIKTLSNKKTVLPKPHTIYLKDYVIKSDPLNDKTKIPKIKLEKSELSKSEKLNSTSSGNGSRDSERLSRKESDDKEIDIEGKIITVVKKEEANNNKTLFHHKNKSRFPFVSASSENLENVIPEYIIEIIDKKTVRYSFFKNFENKFPMLNNFDNSFFTNTLKKWRGMNDSWSDFIINNLEPN